VLRLPKRGVLRRYVEVVIAFLISGVLHRLVDTALGISWDQSGAFRFFSMQPLGILIEEMAQGFWHWFSGTQASGTDGAKPGSGQPATWKRLVGFAWWGFWMGWTLPVWMYPHIIRQGESPVLIRGFPWSVAEKILGVK
jgi:hypothetical protein